MIDKNEPENEVGGWLEFFCEMIEKTNSKTGWRQVEQMTTNCSTNRSCTRYGLAWKALSETARVDSDNNGKKFCEEKKARIGTEVSRSQSYGLSTGNKSPSVMIIKSEIDRRRETDMQSRL